MTLNSHHTDRAYVVRQIVFKHTKHSIINWLDLDMKAFDN